MLRHQIAITLIPGVGDIIAKKLISYCGSVEGVFKEKKNNLLKIPNIGETIVKSIINQEVFSKVDKELEFIEKFKIKTFFYLDDNYPFRLKQCIDGPLLLYFLGNANLNAEKIVSIVGTRSVTEYGKEICKNLIKDLSAHDTLIISGLAYGVDSCAHKTALENNLYTVGVLAHGLDRVYPSLNKSLAEKMTHMGGLLTDFMSETNPDRENFPKRNRIIAGTSDAVIVIEAAKRGGALITAEIANSYNRDVFAVPGKIGDTFSEGCNNLIKTNKAALIQSAEDVVYIMRWDTKKIKQKSSQKQLFIELTEIEKCLYDILSEKVNCSFDVICSLTKYSVPKIAEALLNLELEGIIKSLPGKIYKLA